MRLIPIINLAADFGHLGEPRKIRPARSEVIRARQSPTADGDRLFTMGKDWNNAVRAKRREGGRLQEHARPHFSGAEIINETEGRLPEDFGRETGANLGIVMDR